MTKEEAIKFFEDEIYLYRDAPYLNGCEMTEEWKNMIDIYEIAVSAIKFQIKNMPDEE